MRFLSDGSTTATRHQTTHGTHALSTPVVQVCVSSVWCVCVCLEGSSFAGLRVSCCESQSATTGGRGGVGWAGGRGWVHSQIFSGNETRARREEEEQQQDRCPSPAARVWGTAQSLIRT